MRQSDLLENYDFAEIRSLLHGKKKPTYEEVYKALLRYEAIHGVEAHVRQYITDVFGILPNVQPFNVFLMDPPWNEQGGGKSTRGAQRHYPLMKTHEIIKTLSEECEPLKRRTNTALCYMWVTNNFLPDGLEVMKAIGFRYITNIVWTKDKFGLGQYNRGQHELCLLGRSVDYIGRPNQHASTWLGQKALPRTQHSRKPDEMYEMIEAQWEGPYLELFATQDREGWERWGNGIWEKNREE